MGSRVGLALALAALLIAAAFAYWALQPGARDADRGELEEVAQSPGEPAGAALAPAPAPARAIEPADPVETEKTDPAELLAEFEKLDSDGRTREIPTLLERAREGDDAALQVLLAALSDPETQVREKAALAIGDLRNPSRVPYLAHLVYDADPDIRENLVKALAKLRSPEAGELLTELAGDEDPDVVEDAVLAIIAGNYTTATPRLTVVARGNDPFIASQAAKALRFFGEDEAVDATLPFVAKGLESDDPAVRREAIGLIGQIGGEEALRYLREAAKDPKGSNRRAVTRAIDAVMASLQD